jgi:hypothetical protein
MQDLLNIASEIDIALQQENSNQAPILVSDRDISRQNRLFLKELCNFQTAMIWLTKPLS